jgi:hypothetical protein
MTIDEDKLYLLDNMADRAMSESTNWVSARQVDDVLFAYHRPASAELIAAMTPEVVSAMVEHIRWLEDELKKAGI